MEPNKNNIVSLDEYREKREIEHRTSRAQRNAEILMELKHQNGSESLSDKKARIRHSLSKINALMQECKRIDEGK